MIDRLLNEMGLSRKDLRYNFKHFYAPAFNPLWWLITIVAVVGACVAMYVIVVMLILIAPRA